MGMKKRVIVYTMHEGEQAEARRRLDTTIQTDALTIGEADEAVIADLRAQGLIIRELEPMPATPADSRGTTPGPVRVGAYVTVALREPLCVPHRQALEHAGLKLQERTGHTSFIAQVADAAAVETARALPFVQSVQEYFTAVRQNPSLEPVGADAGPPPPGLATAPAGRQIYEVLLHELGKLPEVTAFATQHNIGVMASGGRKLRVQASAAEAEALNELDTVALVEEYVPPKLYNDRARRLIWPSAPTPPPLTGAGEIIAVADSGLDATHVAFQGRVAKTIPRGRLGDTSDPHGHGTHVAATIVGADQAQQGLAPGSQLVFQSVMDNQGDLTGLPLDLGDLFAEAYAEGARIHNDSWGADLASTYTLSSLEVDGYVHAHKDMLVVIAAGNAGASLDPPRHAQRGCVEWGSIGAPATSKNALVVGASRSDRTNGGLARLTYGDVWGRRFPLPPTATEPVSGDPECLAAFSGRGPCNDQRIKPDVVAPGTDILSAKAATAPAANFAEVIALGGAAYGYMSGTSMAAPAVAGVAALVREYLRRSRAYATPSAALLKAIIINGTRWLTGTDARADHARLPNFHQGFGAVHLPTTLPLDGGFVLAFLDNWQAPADHITQSGMRRRYSFRTTRSAPLRLTLAYTDPPGRGVQNDLSLFVQLPGGEKRLGNEDVPLAVFQPDPNNNVETLRFDDAAAGSYLIQVTATTILGPQDFALVVTGALEKDTLDPE